MKIYWTLGLLGFILLCQESSSGTLCLSCNDLTEGELCTRVEMCKNDEVCFIQKYSANGNDYRYDVGCSYPELCRKDLTGHVLGRRGDHNHVICHKCCNNSDTCNVRLSCNDKIDVPLQKCSSCSGIADPSMCKNTTTCATDELCTHGYLNILGRRSSIGVHQECESCCSGTALCNQDLQCDHHSQKTINSSCSTVNECIGNSICLSGICKCPSDEYYWNVDTCIEKKSANERCSEHSHCKTPLHCLQNVCHCMDTEYWNGSSCRSQKTHDSSCVSSDDCLGTLFCIHGLCKCDRTDYWSGSLCAPKRNFNATCNINEPCRDTLQCINNICICIQAEYWNGMLCLSRKNFNSSCNTNEECNDTYRCIDNVCSCTQSEYLNRTQCVSKKSFNSTCNANEQCKHNYRCIDKICRCTQAEYLNDTQCLPKKHFNSTCYINEPCRKPLRCINNVCKCFQAEYWNGTQCVSKILECEDEKDTMDGVYTIYPGGGDMALSVYCIMGQTKKWTVIQTRSNGSVDFDRNWQEYRHGFGSVYGAYWLGNDNIHMISTNGHHEFSIYMQTGTEHRMANYSTSSVGDERSMYRLTVTGYSGDAGDSMDKFDYNYKANGQLFTTKDRDNDKRSGGNCAVIDSGGWWYNECYGSQFNRDFTGNTGHMYWATWRQDISKSIMMIRRTS